MAENVENGKDTEDASNAADKSADEALSVKENGSESTSSNMEDFGEEVANETESQEDGDGVESIEKKKDDSHENGGDEVVTLDDEGDERVPTKTIPDSVFYESVSEEEKQYYEENPISVEKIEGMKMQCTACFKQVL